MVSSNGPVLNHRIRILDSLRGIAALEVLYNHFFTFNNEFFRSLDLPGGYELWESISGHNKIAVIFFFLLSGFSIALSLKGQGIDSTPSLNNYVYRRLKRILPIYLMSLVLAFFCGAITSHLNTDAYSMKNLLGTLLFLQSSANLPHWFESYGNNDPLWSLAFEFFFYFFFPFVYISDRRYLQKIHVNVKFSLLFVLTLGTLVAIKFVFVPYMAFFSAFIIWLFGYLCGRTYLTAKTFHLIFFGAAAFSVAFLLIGDRLMPSNTLHLYCIGLLIGCGMYFFSIFHKRLSKLKGLSVLERMLNQIFFKVGTGSYAIYSFHYPILWTFAFFKVNVFAQAVIMIGPFIWAAIVVEKNTIRWKLPFLQLNYSQLIKTIHRRLNALL